MAPQCENAITYEGAVELLLSNRFVEAESTFKKDMDASTRHALLYAQVAFARAVLSMAPADAKEAMERCWEANARATKVLQGGVGLIGSLLGGGGVLEDSSRLEQTLVSADAHMMGAMMQLILGNYVKGAWNINTAWSLYSGVFTERQESPDSVPLALQCIVDFGVGMFNLVVSLLPPTYVMIAQLAGFSGDRDQAIMLLNRSAGSMQYWSPVSCLLLLYFYTQLCPNLGMSQPSHAATVDELLSSPAATAYPSASLFLWMQGGSKRLKGQLVDAKELLMRAEEGSRDMPALQAMILNDVVWVTVPSLDFQGATRALAPLLASNDQTPYHSVYAYEAALSLLCQGDADGAGDLFATVADLAGEGGGGEGAAERFAVHMSGYLTESGSKKPSKEQGIAALLELIVLWDAHRMMAKEQAEAAISLLGDADIPQRIRKALISGALHAAKGDHDEAKRLLGEVADASDEQVQDALPGGEAGQGAMYRAFARYSLAWVEGGSSERAMKLLEGARDEAAHHLKVPLSFRVHAALAEAQRQGTAPQSKPASG